MEILTDAPGATIAFAKKIAKEIKPGCVIALKGDLGAGKTTFIKGLALGLGLHDSDEVKSPTFALMHTYESDIPVYHFDLYRLDSEKEIANIGFEEFLSDPQAVSCVEWPERAGALLPKPQVEVTLKIEGENKRRITVKLNS